MTRASEGFVVWGASRARSLGVVLTGVGAVVFLVIGVQASRSGLLVVMLPVAVVFAAAAFNGVLWSLTRTRVTSGSVLVWNVGRRVEIARSEVAALAWAPQHLSRAQVVARWQRSGTAGYLVLVDGARVSLDCTRSAASVLQTALPMPSLETGRARTMDLARALGIEVRDEAGPAPQEWFTKGSR